MEQLHIGVVFGGQSTEHEISCRSVMTVLSAMPKEYKKTAIGITKAGKWYAYFGEESLIASGAWEESPNKAEIFFSSNSMFYEQDGKRVPLTIDVIFPVLHGKFGEDGTIQGLFEMLGIPYVGCGVCPSAVAMDKSMTKLLVSTANIRQADFVLVDKHNKNDLDALIAESEQHLGYPVFVKPCRSGSSVGVTKAQDRQALRAGLENALLYDDRILIEEAIDARELECAVL
ncbi:MAG: D-alanine--D-alanine ligase A, partial [Clostridia bacterium]|nr:D-alanine--D-alanine ligase A [Clostridia bacterium]